MNKVLVMDANDDARFSLTALLRKEGYDAVGVATEASAMQCLENSEADVIIADVGHPSTNGCESFLQWARERVPRAEVIVTTTCGSIDSVIRTIRMGVYDYMIKPVDERELLASVEAAMESRRKVSYLKTADEIYTFEKIVGTSSAMREVIDMALKMSEIDTNVFIFGESGVGKELVARAIHNNAPGGRDKPFIAINCAALPDEILESELFGHAKGSFTGAFKDKVGLIEAAGGGTLFMDEIGESSRQFQSKLLRVIEDREVRRVGEHHGRTIDVRFISATNKDARDLASGGKFRNDLFYRLAVVDLYIPPLRERKEDLKPLVDYFLRDISQRLGRPEKTLAREAMEVLMAYDWPGNVRELRNVCERAIALSGDETLRAEDFPLAYEQYRNRFASDDDHEIISLKEIEKRYIMEIFEKHKNNQRYMAKKLGIGHTTLWRKIKEYKLE
ncbi:MAG: sigma-54 dependent transcriptional regulator [Syntrophales bacterium]|nr:sigma-54 dependent transcriptional regulator [Syntrophales bacterium]MCK9528219.1 sigma-54 dependent transcriptional regulator [Syntrophales bacterium]MDX9921367.1 sigma-54 dependent transcriptional regulator [Syntrophales bacterium]